MRTVAKDDKVIIRDQNGVWKPATIIATDLDGFEAEWKLNAGADTIKVIYGPNVAWRFTDASVSA